MSARQGGQPAPCLAGKLFLNLAVALRSLMVWGLFFFSEVVWMPALGYLSMNPPHFTEEWQAYALIAVAVIGIAAAIVVAVKTRKW